MNPDTRSKEYGDPETRLQGWNVCIQQSVWLVAPEMTWFLMGLAGLDCGLIRKEQTLISKFKAPIQSGLTSQEMTDHNTFSVLWVFGAYEVVRTIHQRLREHSDARVQQSKLCFRVGELKKQFERVRIPLAKLEPPARFPSDTGVAVSGVDFDRCATWFVTPNEHVTRRELSDALLESLHEWNNWIQKEHTP